MESVNDRIGKGQELDATGLLNIATESAGLDDYGDEGFVEPMTRWLDALVAEARLNQAGISALQLEVNRWLVNRLRLEDDVKRHPEILDEEVSDPVVIVGLQRTGTTKLQRMMSTDPSVQRLEFWRLLNPAPFPGADPNGPDPRVAVAREQVALIAQHCPEILAGHYIGAEEADEEIFMMHMTFECLGNILRAHTPSYLEWLLTQPRQRPYHYLRRLLQYLQWQDGGRRGRPWILKAPGHLGNLDSVFATFPAATVLHCHRDPSPAVASGLKLQELFQHLGSDCVDLHENGERMLNYFGSEMGRNLAQRESLAAGQEVLDVSFGEICEDPIQIIRQVYAHRGTALSAEVESRMIRWDHDNPRDKHGKFTYSLDEYGLTRERVDAVFDAYIERFGSSWR